MPEWVVITQSREHVITIHQRPFVRILSASFVRYVQIEFGHLFIFFFIAFMPTHPCVFLRSARGVGGDHLSRIAGTLSTFVP